MSIWPVREACKQDWPAIQKFFKDLDRESRYLYFGFHASDEVIDNVWRQFESRDNDQFFVVELGIKIIGVCQVAHFDNHAEISVAVDREYRNQKIAQTLTERGVLWCKTHGIEDLMMYCIPNHNIIQKIIRKHKLLPLMLSAPAEARFDVPPANLIDHQKETYAHWTSVWLSNLRRVWARPSWL